MFRFLGTGPHLSGGIIKDDSTYPSYFQIDLHCPHPQIEQSSIFVSIQAYLSLQQHLQYYLRINSLKTPIFYLRQHLPK